MGSIVSTLQKGEGAGQEKARIPDSGPAALNAPGSSAQRPDNLDLDDDLQMQQLESSPIESSNGIEQDQESSRDSEGSPYNHMCCRFCRLMCCLRFLLRGCRRSGEKPCYLCWGCCCPRPACLPVRNTVKVKEGSKKDSHVPEVKELFTWDEHTTPPSVEDVMAWGSSFDELMKSTAGRAMFCDFLRGEYSEENIMFWLACEELKKETNPRTIIKKAGVIFERYVSVMSPKEVSLDSAVREIVNNNMLEPNVHCFDEAQLQIYTLMQRDSYPRFINSKLYKTLASLSDGPK